MNRRKFLVATGAVAVSSAIPAQAMPVFAPQREIAKLHLLDVKEATNLWQYNDLVHDEVYTCLTTKRSFSENLVLWLQKEMPKDRKTVEHDILSINLTAHEMWPKHPEWVKYAGLV